MSSTQGHRNETIDVWQAPQLPAWPKNLGRYINTPNGATCEDSEGNNLGSGKWLPDDRGRATTNLIRHCLEMPDLVQRQLNRIKYRLLPAEIALAVADAKLAWEKSYAGGRNFQDWFVGVLIVSAAVVGALLYAGAHAILHGS